MRFAAWTIVLLGAAFVACASRPPPPPPLTPSEPEEHETPDEEPIADASVVVVDAGEQSRPPSTATFEEAMAKPEPIDIQDDRVHLTDAQLTAPMRGVFTACRVPPNAKVTIKTAVQAGRAIGVTISVAFDRGKSTKPPSRATLKAEAKLTKKIVTCADKAVRAVTWPPSRRRDSFTTVF